MKTFETDFKVYMFWEKLFTTSQVDKSFCAMHTPDHYKSIAEKTNIILLHISIKCVA